MPTHRQSILDEIDRERDAQDKQWGGETHDDSHEQYDWLRFIDYQENRMNSNDYRERMIKIAALAIAAVESYDRKALIQQGTNPKH
jgi:hypothetical protein